MDFARLKALIDLVGSAPIAELEIDDGTTKVRIVRAAGASVAATPVAFRGPAPPAPHCPGVEVVPSEPEAPPVSSPMVGTFYRRPSPTEPPFVEIGTTVKAGDTLALIEAMKTLSRIEAPRDGLVRAILVDDGASVEEDQPLVVLE